jgi:cobalt/nickel transport system permease protein
MHIPDAFLPLPQAAVYWIIALIFIALSLRWARRELKEEKVPLVAVLAAGVFAIQTINMALPISIIPGGVSGHVIGAALVAIVLGSPFAAVFILTLVLIMQAVFFGDGGITTMGANIINMGVLAGFLGYYTFRSMNTIFHNQFAAAFTAGWISLFVPAIACAVELAVAGTFPLTTGLILMGIYHSFIGIIEGGVTAFALSLIVTARPDIMNEKQPTGMSKIKDVLIAVGITITLLVAVAAPFVASSYPDGLESAFYSIYDAKNPNIPLIDHYKATLAEEEVITRTGNNFSWRAPFQEYQIGGMEKSGEILAIVLGVLATILIGFGVTRAIARSK